MLAKSTSWKTPLRRGLASSMARKAMLSWVPISDGDLAHVAPHAAFGDVETVLTGIEGDGLVAFEFGHEGVKFLVPHVAKTLVEQQAEDIVLEIARIDGAAEQIRRAPEVPFEFGQGQLRMG